MFLTRTHAERSRIFELKKSSRNKDGSVLTFLLSSFSVHSTKTESASDEQKDNVKTTCLRLRNHHATTERTINTVKLKGSVIAIRRNTEREHEGGDVTVSVTPRSLHQTALPPSCENIHWRIFDNLYLRKNRTLFTFFTVFLPSFYS